METYYLNTLILFFRSQKDQEEPWVAIEEVLKIIDDGSIPEHHKKTIILFTLRYWGLWEVGGPTNGKFYMHPTEDFDPEELELEEKEQKEVNGATMFFPVETFSVKFLNIKERLGIGVCLN